MGPLRLMYFISIFYSKYITTGAARYISGMLVKRLNNLTSVCEIAMIEYILLTYCCMQITSTPFAHLSIDSLFFVIIIHNF